MERPMKLQSSRFFVLAAALTISSWTLTTARAADNASERAKLAKALTNVMATLQDGLTLAQVDGTPISAKFELEDGKLQLSIYTVKGSKFSEIVVNPNTGKIDKAEPITDTDDLKDAAAQKAAMGNAKISLLAATNNALKANSGYRAVSSFPAMKAGHPVADVTLLRGNAYKAVAERLD